MSTEVEYKFGLLSLNADLRQPGSETEPVAVIGTGHALDADTWHFFAMVRGDLDSLAGVSDDPVALGVLRQMMKTVADRVEAADAKSIPPAELLTWVSTGLGGSVSFSWIKTKRKKFAKSAVDTMEIAPWQEFKQFLTKPTRCSTASQPKATVGRHFGQYSFEPYVGNSAVG